MNAPPAGNRFPTDLTDDTPLFKGRFGRKVGGLLAVASFLVLLFGLIHLWLSYQILENSERIRHLNDDIRRMEEINLDTHLLLGALEYRMTHKEEASKEIRALSEKLLRESGRYDASHRLPNWKWLEEGNEMHLFRDIRGRLMEISKLALAPGERDEEIKAKIRALTPEFAGMAAIHERAADEINSENRIRMLWIFDLYYTLVVVGAMIIIGGIFWTTRSIVRPVKRLAAAAQEVAHGNFSKRVEVTSRDEVGQLSHAFNLMAERLAGHERIVQGMATLEERERLAREMHDGLAQNIAFLNLKIDQLRQTLSSGGSDRAREGIRALKETVGVLYNDVRQAIFGLRVMVSRQLGLLPALTEYLHEFSRQTGVHVNLLSEDERVATLPLETEVQLIRIIQEALTNVRKHAQASQVTVTFRKAGENLEAVIEDNGRGVSQTQSPAKDKATFGLQTMDERARSVGGSFEARDTSPTGTRLTVCLPVPPFWKGARTWTG